MPCPTSWCWSCWPSSPPAYSASACARKSEPMRFVFKTGYDQDLDLGKDNRQRLWYGALFVALLLAPWVLPEYWLAQLTFICIYATVGVGLMLLAGYTGQFSIGHAALMGVG